MGQRIGGGGREAQRDKAHAGMSMVPDLQEDLERLKSYKLAHHTIIEAGAITATIAAMRAHPADAMILFQAVRFLCTLVCDSIPVSRSVAIYRKHDKCCCCGSWRWFCPRSKVTHAMRSWLSFAKSIRAELVRAGGIDVVASAMKQTCKPRELANLESYAHEDGISKANVPTIIQISARLLAEIALDRINHDILTRSDAIEVVLDALRAHSPLVNPVNEFLHVSGCAMLARMLMRRATGQEVYHRMQKAGGDLVVYHDLTHIYDDQYTSKLEMLYDHDVIHWEDSCVTVLNKLLDSPHYALDVTILNSPHRSEEDVEHPCDKAKP